MKRLTAVVAAIAALSLAVSSAQAQNPLTVAPQMYKLKFENERVRVMEVTFKPGDTIAAHSHPDHYVYAASGGTLRIFHSASDTGAVVPIKTGDIVWLNAETHWAKNIGKTTVDLIVNELKEPKPAMVKDDKK